MSLRRTTTTTTTAPPGAEQNRLQQVLRAGQARAAATGAPDEESSSSSAPFGASFCRWWPVSDGLFDVHYTPQPADYNWTIRGADSMIQTVIRVVADPLKHCSDGTYPGGVPRAVANAAGAGGADNVVDVALGVPRWKLGTEFKYLWRTAVLKGQVFSADRQVEVKFYSCTINLNGTFPNDLPKERMTPLDLETQNVVDTFVRNANSSDPGSNPTTLPPIDLKQQDYVVMTTSILKGCERCITSIGMAPTDRGHVPSGEFFTAMMAQCPYHALGALPSRLHVGAGRKRPMQESSGSV